MKPLIGFIGQGWIGKNYADDFERRGLNIVRYALEAPYAENKDKIAACDIVFIAVPTPTTKDGFDASYIRAVLPLIGDGKAAVIKSTMLPGMTKKMQEEFPNIVVLHSPEFLREAHAAEDAAHPDRNIIGMPVDDAAHRAAAELALTVLPESPYKRIMGATEAELVKYAGNVFLAMKVVYANMLYDLAGSMGISYEDAKEAIAADPRIGISHLSPVLASGHSDKAGRGAGGHCFIKDVEAFRRLYEAKVGDAEGDAFLADFVRKNVALLTASQKDLELLDGVYRGTEFLP